MIVGLCRFSFLDIEGWKSVPRGLEDAKRYLFDKDRLEHRFALFERYTLPSMDCQTDDDFRMIILTAKEMPKEYLDRLRDVTRSNDRIAVHALPTQRKGPLIRKLYYDAFGRSSERVSFRIDDDDGLSADYIRRLREQVAARRESGPFFVSFSKGIVVKHSGGAVDWASECASPFFSAGLALSSPERREKCVYDYPHHRCYRRFDTVVLSGAPAYLRCVHGYNDSKTRGQGTTGFSATTLAEIARTFRAEFPYLRPDRGASPGIPWLAPRRRRGGRGLAEGV